MIGLHICRKRTNARISDFLPKEVDFSFGEGTFLYINDEGPFSWRFGEDG
jgi:hypothetical protein